MGELLHLEACPPRLQEQFTEALGEDFSVRALINNLQERSLFKEARGVINSFVPADYQLKTAVNSAYEDLYISSGCVPDGRGCAEKADYRLSVYEGEEATFENQATISISPRALGALHRPLASIAETLAQEGERALSTNELAHIAYRSVYAKTVGELVIKHAVRPAVGDDAATAKFEEVANGYYPAYFGTERIDDFVSRLDRLSMCFGGAVMLRSATVRMSSMLDEQYGAHGVRIGQMLKMYGAGLLNAKTFDQQRVSFALAHAFNKHDVPKFIRAWFS